MTEAVHGEFSSLTEVADELGLDQRVIPPVRREFVVIETTIR